MRLLFRPSFRPWFRPLSCFLLLCCIRLALPAHASTIHPVRGFLPDLRFTLVAQAQAQQTGQAGQGVTTLTQDAFRGKVVILFFGYANCPDICPTTMVQLTQVMEKLGNEAERVRVLFISVDPHRDTPDILQAYVHAFDPRAVGLTGTPAQISDVARRYRVSWQIDQPAPGDDANHYAVAHSRGIFFFDAKGRARFLASDAESVDALTEIVRSLLRAD